jgi:membrane associated rhomboid family serine protease
MFPLSTMLNCIRKPTATTIIIWINCFFFLIEQALIHSGYGGIVNQIGAFSPLMFSTAYSTADPLYMALMLIPLFLHMWLHGGLMHLFGNMVYLNCFGRAVEARLGWKQYVAFYLVGGLVANAGSYMIAPWSPIPGLGASGAIAAVLSAYLILWPRSRITGFSLENGIASFPAWSFLSFWIGMQLITQLFANDAATAADGGELVNYMAHISGFAFGILAGFFVKFITPVEEVCYVGEGASEKECG